MESAPLYWRLKRQKYNLIGTRCVTCGESFFPPRSFCPTCRRRGRIEEFQFSGKGEITSYTIIKSAPKGFEQFAPYTVAIIKLDEGALISGQVVQGTPATIGGRVVPVFRKMYEEGKEGIIHYGIKWQVDGTAAEK
ncbi:MAG: Zn-ribbon domain-containing OB-fold protein [Candidatus Aenigmarchaeota archaeon]|nr:Zn-ribbon domain-containing OB-fold protein [Candidatus Aenigmarchaeota archaeon]